MACRRDVRFPSNVVTRARSLTDPEDPSPTAGRSCRTAPILGPNIAIFPKEFRKYSIKEGGTMKPWDITDGEWEELGSILEGARPSRRGRGKPRREARAAAEAILYHHHHSRSRVYSTFGWNDLPGAFGVSPSTANRRF